MPERVTKEERTISLAIEKARSAKEELLLSLENNRSPLEKDNIMEKIKVTKPKAAKVTQYKTNTNGKEGYGLGGEITEFKKSLEVLKFSIAGTHGPKDSGDDNPIWNKERKEELENLIEQLTKEIDDLKAELESDKISQEDFTERMQRALRDFNQEGILGKPNEYR
jgi:hypothetical protein